MACSLIEENNLDYDCYMASRSEDLQMLKDLALLWNKFGIEILSASNAKRAN